VAKLADVAVTADSDRLPHSKVEQWDAVGRALGTDNLQEKEWEKNWL